MKIVFFVKKGLKMADKRNIEDIIDELCEYAEAAGFADYYNRELKGKSEEEIVKIYENVFEEK